VIGLKISSVYVGICDRAALGALNKGPFVFLLSVVTWHCCHFIGPEVAVSSLSPIILSDRYPFTLPICRSHLPWRWR